MPVPSSIDDLSTTASSNSPAGGETPKDGDNYIRAHAAFIATLRDKLDGTSATGTVNAATFTGTHTFGGNLTSGTYTPTLTNGANVTSSAAQTFTYQRIGNVVQVFGNMQIEPTASGSECSVNLTLPVASALTDTHQLSGVVTRSVGSATESGRVIAVAAGDLAGVRIVARSTSNEFAAVAFSYQVL